MIHPHRSGPAAPIAKRSSAEIHDEVLDNVLVHGVRCGCVRIRTSLYHVFKLDACVPLSSEKTFVMHSHPENTLNFGLTFLSFEAILISVSTPVRVHTLGSSPRMRDDAAGRAFSGAKRPCSR